MKKALLFVMFVCLLIFGTSVFAQSGTATSIVKAPIAPDGTVAGAATDFVVNFDVSFDPSVSGYTLLEGNSIAISLPEGFTYDDAVPFQSVGGADDCVPGNIQCNTGVLLQGWPQRPIGPPAASYSFEYDEDTNSIIYTALRDIVPNPPEAPGVKQAHLVLTSFTNPDAGEYMVEVTTEFGEDGTAVTSSVPLNILPAIAPSINHVSVFNEGAPNTIYQTAGAGEMTPLPFDFLLFDASGAITNVSVMHVSEDHALLMQAEWVVGHVYIDAPDDASGYAVMTEASSTMINAPVLGNPAGRLTVMFQAGDTAGDYTLTFALNNGNAVQRFVTVE